MFPPVFRVLVSLCFGLSLLMGVPHYVYADGGGSDHQGLAPAILDLLMEEAISSVESAAGFDEQIAEALESLDLAAKEPSHKVLTEYTDARLLLIGEANHDEKLCVELARKLPKLQDPAFQGIFRDSNHLCGETLVQTLQTLGRTEEDVPELFWLLSKSEIEENPQYVREVLTGQNAKRKKMILSANIYRKQVFGYADSIARVVLDTDWKPGEVVRLGASEGIFWSWEYVFGEILLQQRTEVDETKTVDLALRAIYDSLLMSEKQDGIPREELSETAQHVWGQIEEALPSDSIEVQE